METQKKASRRREGFCWIVVVVALVAGTAIFLRYSHCARDYGALQQKITSLTEQDERTEGICLLSESHLNGLREKGLENPVDDLIADLLEHAELIPYKGVMGGTMGFYSKKDIHILTPRWVLATFEDGHIKGHMLLEYTVAPGGQIYWKVVSASLD
jgi:hypothetical protein